MEDPQIVQLYWDRSEQAITETDRKYGAYCAGIAYGILQNREDTEETVSDSYMGAWNAMPPHRPSVLATFLGKIVRRIAIDKWRSGNRAKRGGGEIILALEELGECVPGGGSPEQEVQREELARSVNRFLDGISLWERRVFLARYWYLDSIREIADHFAFSQSKVQSMLFRTRNKLRQHLEKEGYL